MSFNFAKLFNSFEGRMICSKVEYLFLDTNSSQIDSKRNEGIPSRRSRSISHDSCSSGIPNSRIKSEDNSRSSNEDEREEGELFDEIEDGTNSKNKQNKTVNVNICEVNDVENIDDVDIDNNKSEDTDPEDEYDTTEEMRRRNSIGSSRRSSSDPVNLSMIKPQDDSDDIDVESMGTAPPKVIIIKLYVIS